MPLIKSSSRPAFVSNLKAELSAGKPRDQALAIAYAVKRRKKKRKGYADGGAPELSDADQAAMMPETFVNPLVKSTIDSTARLASTPGAVMQPNPYPPGSESAVWYDDNRQKTINDSAPEGALAMMGGSGVVPAEANSLRMGIKAYHGSPHSFDAFDTAKIGTGEGAQAYGHGLYFADNEGVAKSYRDALSGQLNDPATRTLVDGKPLAEHPDFVALSPNAQNRVKGAFSFSADKQSALNTLDYQLENGSGLNKIQRPDIENARNFVDGLPDNMGRRARDPGSMYEVNINADPEQFLDWDKPLSEQPQNVQDAARSLKHDPSKSLGTVPDWLKDAVGRDEYTPTGFSLYQDVRDRALFDPSGRQNPSAAASAALNQAGIPGIKYLDQHSRAAGDGSRNYVVFNDKLVNILKKYGIAGLPAGAAAALSGNGEGNSKMKAGGAVNAAMDVARRTRRARGGKVFTGPIDSDVPGRTDEHEMNVEDGSYVLPSETISHLGQNNTDAGFEVAKRMFPHSARRTVKLKRAKGGAIPVITAGGEFVISRKDAERIGGGDLAYGHRILDRFVMDQRKHHIETLKSLDGPAQD